MATETVKTKDKVPVLMAGCETAGASSILKAMSQNQEVNELMTTSEVKDNDYNITFDVWYMHNQFETIIPCEYSYFNKSEAMIYVINSCDRGHKYYRWEHSVYKLKQLLDVEKFDKRPRPLLIWLNNKKQMYKDPITVREFRESISKGLKYQLRKRIYSIKPVNLSNPETLRRGFSWLAFEYQKTVEEKKEDKEEEQEIRVFMAGLENVGKSTILAKMLGEDTTFWKDFSFLRTKVDKTTYEVWKVPGQEVESRLWKYELKDIQILIFVVDSDDGAHTLFEQTFDELRHLLNIEELRSVPLLVFFNKLDESLNHWSMFSKHLTEKLETELLNRAYYVQHCIAARGEGLLQGFKMLQNLKKEQEVGRRVEYVGYL